MAKDSIKLLIHSGTGGNGLTRFNGIGGNGGSVFVRATEKIEFDEFCRKYEERPELVAEHGEHSKQVKLVGKNGQDLVVDVPLGVEIINEEHNKLLARCSGNRQRYLLASGGKGGCAENEYIGEKGEKMRVSVHLKLRPNLGLIGYPNAGKSTLMKALVPRVDVEIADYPFTTSRPQVCFLDYNRTLKAFTKAGGEEGQEASKSEELLKPIKNAFPHQHHFHKKRHPLRSFHVSLSIADLPGIVEGAAKNLYGGLSCLRHLEHSEIILMVVDVNGFRLGADDPPISPLETIALLNREMEAHDRKMVRKPVVLLLNKIDTDNGEKIAQQLCEHFLGPDFNTNKWTKALPENVRPRFPIRVRSVHAISAREGKLGNLRETIGAIYSELHPLRKQVFEEDEWENEKKKGGKRKRLL